MVDTNSDPREIDYAIPSNDDASKSIEKIITSVTDAVAAGLAERKSGKEDSQDAPKKEKKAKKEETAAKPKRKRAAAASSSEEE